MIVVNLDGVIDIGAVNGNKLPDYGCVPVAGCDAVISR